MIKIMYSPLYDISQKSHYLSPAMKLFFPAITRRIVNFRKNETRETHNGSDNNKNTVRRLAWNVKDCYEDNVGQ